MTRRSIVTGLGLTLFAASPCPAGTIMVPLTVRYRATGPSLTLSSEPATPFRCATARAMVTCTAHVPRGIGLMLRARTRSPAGSAGVSAMAFPIDGSAWGGACAGTPADVCRLHATHPLSVRIDTRDQ